MTGAHHLVMTMTTYLQTAGPVDISGDTFRQGITKLAGNFFIAILGVLGVIALLRKKVVEVLELIGLAILAGAFTYKPEIFSSLATAITTFFVK
jgi:hypothetical protein